jgi:hypothetical protein
MTTDRMKPGVAFWVTVGLVVVLVGYPLSFGPACWISERTATIPRRRMGSKAISITYQPMLYLWMRTKYPGRAVSWYALVGTRDEGHAINTVGGRFVLNWATE